MEQQVTGNTQHPGGSLVNYFFSRMNFLVGEFMAAEPAALSFSFLGTLKQKMPSSVISSFGVKGRAGPGSSGVCRTLV